MKIPCFMIILYAAFTFIIHPRLVLSFRPRSTISRRCHAQNNDRTYFVIRSSSRCHNNIESFDDETPHRDSIYRRKFFAQVSTTITLLTFAPSFAKAQGLVLFPCTTPLSNIYHVMRAGQTLLEEEDILTTNPMFLTNREAALSEKGIAQVEDACRILERNQINPSVIKYSLAASAMDTTRIVKDELKVGQNRIIPEFTFMDPRGIGQWDMMSYAQTLPAIVALDEAEAGKQGKAGRPPPNEDGTPNETLADQYIRLVQLMSVLETQFQGDTVLLIFPDGTSPALLSCMMAGIPFNKVHELDFAPGEVRLDLTMQSALDFYELRKLEINSSDEYQKTLEKGKAELQRLRSLDPDQMVSKKDMKIEKERLEMEEQQRQKYEERALREERERQARLIRQQELEEIQEQTRIKKQQEGELARMKRSENLSSSPGSSDKTMPLAVGGVVSAAVIAVLATGSEKAEPASVAVTNAVVLDRNETGALLEATNMTLLMNGTLLDRNETYTGVANAKSGIPKEDASVEAPEQNVTTLPASLPEVSLPISDATTSTGESLFSSQPMSIEDKKKEAEIAMQDYLDRDDGGEDWLTVMGQLMQEEDEDENGTIQINRDDS